MSTSRFAPIFAAMALAAGPAPSAAPEGPVYHAPTQSGQGTLKTFDEEGRELILPLRHTSVRAEIAGFVARVRVMQLFHNPCQERIEAIYVFPLPENAAVDQMIMEVGDRVIYAEIETREEARRIYEEARAAGKRAGLLEQERPNIFTQSVANIRPGESIRITIEYVQTLAYDRGRYRFVFPMVVGPRFIPGAPSGKQGTGWSPDTDQVPDASRITPPVLKPDVRSGHDIDLAVELEAGVPIRGLRSKSHRIEVLERGRSARRVALAPDDTIPNKDFILEYAVAGEKPEVAVLAHRALGGYFLLMIQPKARLESAEITPREIIFVVDCSGSMRGAPIAKAKEAMVRCLKGLRPTDAFQVIRFSTKASRFSPHPIAATPENIERGIGYVQAMAGSGGTMMIEGIKAALDYPPDPDRLRIVAFMTDGYIGNERQILAAVEEKIGDARLFSFGVGSSVNRYLLECMARVGRGFAQFVRPDEETESAVSYFYDRIDRPFLTNIEIDWAGAPVEDVLPDPIPDLFEARPVFLVGRYKAPFSGTIAVTGRIGGDPYEQYVDIELPMWEEGNEALAALWARREIEELELGQLRRDDPKIVRAVTDLALDFHLMSRFTSLVAVDEELPEEGATTLPRRIAVPVPLPEGVSFEGIFGAPGLYPGPAVEGIMAGDEVAEAETDALRLLPAPAGTAAWGRADRRAGLRYKGRPSTAGGIRLGKAGAALVRTRPRRGYAGRRAEAAEFAGLELRLRSRGEALDAVRKDLRDLAARDRERGNRVARAISGSMPAGEANPLVLSLLSSDDEASLRLGLFAAANLAGRGVELAAGVRDRVAALVAAGKTGPIRALALWALRAMSKEGGLSLEILIRATSDEDRDVRLLAAALLGTQGGEGAEPVLARLARDPDDAVAAVAIAGLRKLEAAGRYVAMLVDRLRRAKPEAFRAALEAALALRESKAIDPADAVEVDAALRAALALKGCAPLRALAAAKLAESAGPAREALLEALRAGRLDDQPEAAAKVILGLRGAKAEGLAAVARDLVDRWRGRRGRLARAAALEALLEAGDEADRTRAIARLRLDRSWEVRRAILAGLARRGVCPEIDAIPLGDPHPLVRRMAIALAAAAAHPDRPWLAALGKEPTAATCGRILREAGLPEDAALRSREEIARLLEETRRG